MKIEFEATNLNLIYEKLENIAEDASIQQALGKACALVERSAKEKAPKDTGALRRSITSRIENGEGIVYTPLEYAPYVEYGTGLFAEVGGRNTPWSYQDDEGEWHTTSGQHPQPFMRPALEENRDKIIEIFKEATT